MIRGNVVNVPLDVAETVKSLPRLPNDHDTVQVDIKRDLKYKNVVMSQSIRPSRVRDLAEYLCSQKLYKDQNITYDNAWSFDKGEENEEPPDEKCSIPIGRLANMSTVERLLDDAIVSSLPNIEKLLGDAITQQSSATPPTDASFEETPLDTNTPEITPWFTSTENGPKPASEEAQQQAAESSSCPADKNSAHLDDDCWSEHGEELNAGNMDTLRRILLSLKIMREL